MKVPGRYRGELDSAVRSRRAGELVTAAAEDAEHEDGDGQIR